MPYAVLQKEIEKLDESQQDFDNGQAEEQPQSKITNRKLGGFEKGFYIAPDFDAPFVSTSIGIHSTEC